MLKTFLNTDNNFYELYIIKLAPTTAINTYINKKTFYLVK